MNNIFSSRRPTKILWVASDGLDTNTGSIEAPLKTIQKAVALATAGTAVIVRPGQYVENVKFPSRSVGTLSAPTWLISEVRHGAVLKPADPSKRVIQGLGTDNQVVAGFRIFGGYDGIQFSMSGSDFTNPVNNIVVMNNWISDTTQDGIKISQGVNVQILGNTIERAGKEAIDFVAVNDSLISGNYCNDTKGTAAAIFTKGGSTNVKIEHNLCEGGVQDGIAIGGWGDLQYSWPNARSYQAKNVIASRNIVQGFAKRPFNVLGALDSKILDNFMFANPEYMAAITIEPDNNGLVSDRIEIARNIMLGRSDVKKSSALPSTTVISIHDNLTQGSPSHLLGLFAKVREA